MTLAVELADFYRRSGFGTTIGSRPRTVRVFTGCLLVPMPNIETRRRYLKYHDLHHLITGYSIGRIGEGEVSAWELASGSTFVSPTLGIMNLIALSTGLVLKPQRMWRAFVSGCTSRNLYPASVRAEVDRGRWQDVAALRIAVLNARKTRVPLAFRAIEFSIYSIAAMIIHCLIAGPAVCVRFVTDITLGYSVFQAAKPKPRTDLY